MEREKTGSSGQTIFVEDRHSMEVTGITEVISFDEKQVILNTKKGMLTVKGKEMKVKRLSLEQGELEMSGCVDGLIFSHKEERKKKTFIEKIFG